MSKATPPEPLSLRGKRCNAGFTLIETLVFLGLFAIIGSIGLMGSMETYKGYSFRDDRDLLVSALHKARSQAVHNICLGAGCSGGKAHGVHIEAGQLTIFQGASYVARDPSVDEVIKMGSKTTQVSSATDVMFAKLSGSATTLPAGMWDITMSDGMTHTSTITINTEGRIAWTN